MSEIDATISPGQVILEMKGITKAFPGIVANSDVDFDLKKGEIHCLLGENGAGKSTLMKILYGLYKQDKGEVFYKGEPLVVNGPADTLRQGIGMVHQHFMLIKPLTVAENLVLGNEPTKYGFLIDKKKAKAELMEISTTFGLAIEPDAKIMDISVGMQQRVEILKALHRGAEVLILDEPTAVLTPQETKELFVIMRKLVHDGKSIIFISHKLKEVMEISDRVTVINHGRIIGSVKTSETSPSQLANMMVGREVELIVHKEPAKPGKEKFRAEGLVAENDRGLPALRGIDLSVRAGEILGVC
ncbi:MAG TPA: ATP-binding cassette domain-containing protein, partial [Bacillota bacterium]|nr:ATP-binding cassette domain-containing protein [Bacillota bacterium]